MQQVWDTAVTVVRFIFGHLVFFNLIFAVIIVFFQRRDPKTVWTWLMLLYFIPILGFIFYLFLGTDMHKRKMFKVKEIEDKLNEAIRQQELKLQSNELQEHTPDIEGFSDLVMFNLSTTGAMLSDTNDIDIFTDGNVKFEALLADLRQAKEFIHIQYYIIKNDVLFNRIREVLEEKLSVMIPDTFGFMPPETAKYKYPSEFRPQVILCDSTEQVNMTFSRLEEKSLS